MVLCVARQSLRRLAGFFCVFMQKDLVFNSFLEYNLGMATITQDQLAEFAYKAALSCGNLLQQEHHCPTSYLGWIIPDQFPNGEESYEIWAMAYREGLEDAGTYMAQGAEDRARDWQD